MRLQKFAGWLLACILLLAACQPRTPIASNPEETKPGTTQTENRPHSTDESSSGVGTREPSPAPSKPSQEAPILTVPEPSFPSKSPTSPAPTVSSDTSVKKTDRPSTPAVSSAVPTKPAPRPSVTAPVQNPDPGPPAASGLTPLAPEQYYGRQLLKKRDSRLLEAYERIESCCAAYQDTADLMDLGLTLEEANMAYIYFLDDHPAFFWLDNQCRFSYFTHSGLVVSFTPLYTISGKTAIEKARAAVEKQAAALLAGLREDMDEFQREQIIHDRLIRLVEYDATQSKAHIHTLYGALVNRSAVCDGYSRAFQYLLHQAGMQCLIVRGNGGGESHAWNVARVNGSYYQVDVTWDDPLGMNDPDYVYYGYLNLTDAQMARDHSRRDEGAPPPNCTATADNYFLRNGYTVSALDAEQFGDAVAKQVNNGVTGWYQFRFTGGALSEHQLSVFVNQNADAICRSANSRILGERLSHLSRYSINGDVVQLLFG